MLAVLLWLVVVARELVNSLVIAGLLAYLLKPPVDWTERVFRIERRHASSVVYLVFLAIVIALPISFAPRITRFAAELVDNFSALWELLLDAGKRPLVVWDRTLLPAGWTDRLVEPFNDGLDSNILGSSVDLLRGLGENVIWVLVILVSVFYLLRDGPRLRDWLISLLPLEWQDDARDLVDDIDKTWRRYLRGQIILGIIVGALTFITLSMVGVKQAAALALIAGVFDLVPSLGPMVAGLIATLVALIAGSESLPLSNFLFALLVLGLFLLIQQIENIWLRPQILGQSLKLHPGLIFVAVFGALATFGVLGALTIIPILGSLAVIGRYAHPRIFGVPLDIDFSSELDAADLDAAIADESQPASDPAGSGLDAPKELLQRVTDAPESALEADA